jgi:hypothetical protein
MIGQLLFPKDLKFAYIEDYKYAFMIETPDIIHRDKNYQILYKRGWGNGYVILKRGHPLYNAPIEIVDASVTTHHNITFAQLDKINEVFIVGFHTAYPDDTKKTATKEYVTQQTINLHNQLYGPGWE